MKKKRKRVNAEFVLRDYLAGRNISKVKPGLFFKEKEHFFPGGRIDILAEEHCEGGVIPVGIELKARDYNTKSVCVQALNYLNYLSQWNGKVFFIAPKVKIGVYSTLKKFYEEGLVELYEFTAFREEKFLDFAFESVGINDLDDTRKLNSLDSIMKGDIIVREDGSRAMKKNYFHRLFTGKGKLSGLAKSINEYTEKKDLKSFAGMAEKGFEFAMDYKSGKNRKKVELLRDIARIYKKL